MPETTTAPVTTPTVTPAIPAYVPDPETLSPERYCPSQRDRIVKDL